MSESSKLALIGTALALTENPALGGGGNHTPSPPLDYDGLARTKALYPHLVTTAAALAPAAEKPKARVFSRRKNARNFFGSKKK